MPSKPLTLTELAQLTNTKRNTLQLAARWGVLPTVREGRAFKVLDGIAFDIVRHGWAKWKRLRIVEMRDDATECVGCGGAVDSIGQCVTLCVCRRDGSCASVDGLRPQVNLRERVRYDKTPPERSQAI